MAPKFVSGEQAFQVPSSKFTISPSAEGYTLQFGVEEEGTFTNVPNVTAANTTESVVNANPANWYKLSGNASDLKIVY